jgi:Tol biopolymer transport system component
MPRWSHDGGWIVYSTIRRSREALIAGAREEADDVWAVRGDGSDLTRLSDDPAPEWWPVLGARLFFVSWHEGHQRIVSAKRPSILSMGSNDAGPSGR